MSPDSMAKQNWNITLRIHDLSGIQSQLNLLWLPIQSRFPKKSFENYLICFLLSLSVKSPIIGIWYFIYLHQDAKNFFHVSADKQASIDL